MRGATCRSRDWPHQDLETNFKSALNEIFFKNLCESLIICKLVESTAHIDGNMGKIVEEKFCISLKKDEFENFKV